MKLPPYYPKAEWRASPNFYPSSLFTLKAAVGHSSVSPLWSEPPRRFFDATAEDRGSTHNWIQGNGHFIQMVRFDCGAFGNGVLNRTDGASSPNALVREWYRTRRNPNYDTISTEITGYGVSSETFTAVTDDQWDSWFQFLDWCASEGVEFTGDAMLVHQDISATACPDGRFTVADLLRKVGNEVTQEQLAALTARIVELERRTGATPPNEQRARNADLLLYADGLNTAIHKNIEAIDELQEAVKKLETGQSVPFGHFTTIAKALELASNELRGIDRHVDGTREGRP